MRSAPMAMLCAAALLLAGAGAAPRMGAVDDQRMRDAAADPANWVVNGGDFAGRHFSGLAQINEQTLPRLKPAWVFDLDTTRGQESEPIVVDGTMYVTSAWSKVFALDAATGRLKWEYDPKVWGPAGARTCCDVVNRGAAVYKGRVYVGTIDGRLIALDAATGKPAWTVDTIGGLKGAYTITGAPRVFNNIVVIGNGGADLGARGFVTAYDTETGRQLWRFYTVPGQPGKRDGAASDDVLEKIARPTWFGDRYWRSGGGGTAWNAIAYDPELDRLYIGTGNGSPWNRLFRSEGKGDNLFLCSVIALDARTGHYLWHYQENPGDSWDYNAVQPFIQADLTIDGRVRKVLLHAPKNGYFYVIDRETGKLVSAGPLMKSITWTTGIDASGRPKEAPGVFYEKAPFMMLPNPAGAHNWYPMALDPKTKLVFVPVREAGAIFRSPKSFEMAGEGMVNDALDRDAPAPGTTLPVVPAPQTYLLAWDPLTQKARWRAEGGGYGVLATAGGLVFQGRGAGTGELLAYRAIDGQLLWRHRLPNAVLPGPISYSVNGEQYVAMASGDGAMSILFSPSETASQPGRIVAFKLDGKATLPPDPGPLPPFNASTIAWPAATVAQGRAGYELYCQRCHGMLARPSNVLPDLRRSAVLADKDAWQSIVIGGALADRGMISWKHVVSPALAEAIRAYLDDDAQKAKAADAS